MDVKDLGTIAKKFVEVTPGRAGQYEKGVRNPRRDWAAATAEAEERYKTGVTQAAAAGRFGRGVRKAGTARQQKGAIDKGVSRFGPGVAVAEASFQEGFGPFHQVLQSTTLPPRFARRDPRNLARVAAVAMALGKAKESQLGK